MAKWIVVLFKNFFIIYLKNSESNIATTAKHSNENAIERIYIIH